MNKFCWLLLLLLLPVTTFAFDSINYAKLFPAVVQGHHGVGNTCQNNAQITVNDGAHINGVGGVALNYCASTINPSVGGLHCDSASGAREDCSISKEDIAGLDLSSTNNHFILSTDTSGVNYDRCDGGITLGTGGQQNFGSLNFNSSGCTLNFSPNSSEYYIKSLTLNGTTMNLAAGDYWVESLTFNGSASTINTNGNVRLFVKNAVNVGSGTQINPQASNLLTLIAYDSVTFNSSNIVFNGYIYSDGTVTINGSDVVNGRITSKNLLMNSNSQVNDATYGSVVPSCESIFTDPPTGSHSPNGLYPPSSLGSSLGNLSCTTTAPCSFLTGDYNYANGSIIGTGSSADQLRTSSVTTRLYFDSLSLKDANLNTSGSGANLIIYVRKHLDIQGDTHMNGILYLADGATVNGSYKLHGAIAAGGLLNINGNSIAVDLSVVNEADFGGMCTKQHTDTIDHFELHYASSPLVCAPENITVYACKDSSCSNYYTGTINASVSPTSVSNGYWLGGNGLAFANGVASIQLKKNDSEPITIGIADSTPTAIGNTLCVAGNGTATTAACTMSFAEAGLLFDVPDKLAAKPATVLISAVKKDDSSQQCVPAFVGRKTIRFWSDYINPASFSGYTPQPMTVNNRAIGTSIMAASNQTLTFNSSGQTTVSVNYVDAGKMQLNAQYLGTGDDAGMDVNGADDFVSFPVGLCVTPKERNAECTNTDYATCAAYKKAGASFPLLVTAKAWQSDGDTDICDNTDTPSFAMNNVSLGHQLVAPTAGLLGSLGVSRYDQQAGTAGTLVNQSISEVGVFSFSAYSEQAYLGSNAFTLLPAYSVAIGRFYPAAFELTGVAMNNSCGSFSYMDQPFPLGFTLTALNAVGTKTSNYMDSFAKGLPILHAENNDNGVDLSERLSRINTSWQLGSLIYAGTPTFARTTAPNVDGSFSRLILGVDVSDSDSVPMFLPDMNATSAGNCQTAGDCVSQQLGNLNMRHGRIVLANTYGPENQQLLMPGQAQYWNGSHWQLNSDDSCSLVTPALQTQVDDSALGYVFDPALANGQSIQRAGDGKRSHGELQLLWRADGGYQGKVTAPLAVPDWLKWYWDWNGNNSELLDPRASAYFGRYRGNDRIINWREVR